MLEFSKKILQKVSFDKGLFKKELQKRYKHLMSKSQNLKTLQKLLKNTEARGPIKEFCLFPFGFFLFFSAT